MNILHREKIVLLGLMCKLPVGGVMWQTLHYLLGFQRLGYEVYYVESHAACPNQLMRPGDTDDGSLKAAALLSAVMGRFNLANNWAFHALHSDGRCYGMSRERLFDIYRSASLIINLHGATQPLPEHTSGGPLIYLETDPVRLQVELQEGLKETTDFLSPHAAFFSFGENWGRPDCKLPITTQFDFRPTRQPVIIEQWDGSEHHLAGPESGRCFTTIANWRQVNRNIQFEGREYSWSKHDEFLRFIDLPSRLAQPMELALSRRSYNEADRALLERSGWRVRDALRFSRDLDHYRQYVTESRAEFTVAKEQNVRLRSGWFSDRSATYLAAGRPVVTQDTAFGNILPTGRGLLAYSTPDEAVAAVESVNADYRRHSLAATRIAREFFDSDVVLGQLLSDLGMSAGRGGRPSGESYAAIVTSSPQVNLRSNGRATSLLIAGSGGLFAYDGQNVEQLDDRETLALRLDGPRLLRVVPREPALRPLEGGGLAQMLTYDADGWAASARIDFSADLRAATWDGSSLVFCTGDGEVVWVAPSGTATRRWKPAGMSVHGVEFHDGRLLFTVTRDRPSTDACVGTGRQAADDRVELIDLSASELLLAGSTALQTPRYIDEMWYACSSSTGEVLRIDSRTSAVRRQPLDGRTCGIAYSNDVVFVGQNLESDDGAVVILSRHNGQVLGRLPVACGVVRDLLVCPENLVQSIRASRSQRHRRGGRGPTGRPLPVAVNAVRTMGLPLRPEEMRVRIEAVAPAEMQLGGETLLECEVSNTSDAIYAAAAPHPIHLTYRWVRENGMPDAAPEGPRFTFPLPLPPGRTAVCPVTVKVPEIPGTFFLRVTLVQEGVAWFDDVDPGNACCRSVRVTTAVEPGGGISLGTDADASVILSEVQPAEPPGPSEQEVVCGV